MIDSIIAFHSATIMLSLAYYFKFRKIDTDFFKKSYEFIINIKNKIAEAK